METHIAFVDYDKAFDRVDRDILWQIMELRGYSYHLIEAIKAIYHNTQIVIDYGKGKGKSETIKINQAVR